MTRQLRDLIRADFDDMPGLCLTKPQMRRLWDLDEATCEEVIRQLVVEGYLYEAPDGEYRHPARASA